STRLALASSQEWGTTGTNAIPFAGNVTTSNVRVTNESILGSDGVSLQQPTANVRLKHTGLYYATIQAAINAAASGDVVQVAGGTYLESITLKAGVTLLGGFNPTTWGRDLVSYPTQITTTGFSDTTVTMRTNSRIDGFTLDGRNLSVGIRISSATGVMVSNCNIIRNDVGVLVGSSSSAEVLNNAVTANISSIQVSSTSGRVALYRNRFESRRQNTTAANIQLVNAQNVDIRNNLIINGEFGLEILSSTVTVANNVITQVQGRAVLSGTQSRLTLHNNAIYNNNFGLFIPSPPITSIEYNYFGKNLTNGNAAFPGPIAVPTNIVDNTNQSPFADETTYVPSEAANPSLVDAGNPAAAYNDRYTNGPGLGTTRNDIGAYGGPEAGRIGPGSVTVVTPVNVNSVSQTSLWPGDRLQFTSGQFTLAGTVSPRYAITTYGQGPEYTIVAMNSAQAAFSLESQNDLTDMALTQNAVAGNGILVQGQNRVSIGGLLVKGFLQGISVDTGTVTINHVTMINNTTGIRVTNAASRVLAFGSLITGSTTGVLNSSGAAVSVANSVMYNPTGVSFSGSVSQTTILSGDPQFWSSAKDNYFPGPTSNTIDIYANQDAGCFEFFFNQGFFTTATLTSTVDRAYQSLTAYLGSTDAQAPTHSMLMTQVQAALIFMNPFTSTTVTLNPTLEVTQNAVQSYAWTLSPTTIANKLAIRLALKSYKFGRSPYLDRLVLAW
ncbi:MAG: right-handed parallel beta-helix repeat-containing protein, partial [Candidatus Margulisiibacteriota bacterium]